MDKQNNIRIVIRIIIVVALIFQLSRLDHVFVGNYTSNEQKIDLTQLKTPKIDKHFNQDDSFVLYYSADDANSLILKVYFEQIMKDTKKQYHAYDLTKIQTLDFSKKQMVILVENLETIKDIGALSDYIEKGGHLLFAQTPVQNTGFYTIYRALGINESGPATITEGLYIKEGLFPGISNEALEADEFINYSMPVTLDQNCKVYMTNKIGTPLLWTYDNGAGKVVFFNGTILLDKVSVGLILRSVALMEERYIYPIINSSVVFLDDYPAPFPNGDDPVIRKEYNKNIKDFYLDVWWPDMLEIATRFKLKYTALMINSYNNKTMPPFDVKDEGEINRSELIILGREIIRQGGEVGLHGYNHQSLTLDQWRASELGYQYWGNQQNMEASLKYAKAKFRDAFPKYDLGVYVPPSNVIGEQGLKAIHNAIPECKVISSVFYEDYQHLNYTQNFEVDQLGLIHFPRFSSGYDNSDFNRWSIINGIASYGVFSHFIHPDDFLDPERNKGKNWVGMYEEFENILEDLNRKYPWLRGQTATQGGNSLVNYLALDYSVDYSAEGIKIQTNQVKFPIYMILKSEKKPKNTVNCQITKIDELNYMVALEKSEAFIEVEGN